MSLLIRPVLTLRIVTTILLAAALTLTGIAGAQATTPPEFVSTWDTRLTSAGSSGDNQVRLPLESTGVYNFDVDWGDGSTNTITDPSDSAVTHTYSTAGVYTITITGTIEGWRFNRSGDRLKITGISSWGPLNFGNSGGYFFGAENLQVTATDAPDLTGTTDLSYAFAWATQFNNGAVGSWDVSRVTSMTGMFAGHVPGTSEHISMTFNQPIGAWNTAALTDPSWMFSGNAAFNQPIGTWDMADVTTLEGMFSGATSFNQPIGSWSTANVTSLSSTFENATSFNQPLNAWDTSSVQVMRAAFYGARSFNQPLDAWDTSRVWHFGISFTDAGSFNQSLGDWDMSAATEVDGMFNGTAMAWNNYDATLIGWAAQTLTPLRSGMTVGAGGRKYTAAAETSRANLVDTQGWPIEGDQLLPSGVPAVTISGAAPPTTPVGSTATTTITVQSSGTAALDITGVSVVGLGSIDYTITSNSCNGASLASLATCTIGLSFAPTRDGHRYTFVRIDSDASTSPDLYDVSAFAYGSCPVSPFDSGSGTSVDPYMIMDIDQLNCINAANAAGQYLYLSGNKYFRLGADIDAGGTTESFQPIGTWWYEFNGDFDGNGHVLSNVVIDDTNAGIFPWMDGGANVYDLIIRDAQVTTLESGGILTAGAWNSTVSNVTIDGGRIEATKGWQVGGLAGFFDGTMSEISSSATVVSVANAEWASVGGLVGQLEGTLSRGISTGSVTASVRATDTVVVAGLLGGTNGVVTDSYSTSTVTVTGGSSGSRVAGFVGDMWDNGTIETSYAAGGVSATTDGEVAGFVGALRNTSSVSNVLWNTQTTGISTDSASSGSTGVTTAAMRSLATYAGWDIAAAPDLTKPWVLRSGYPAQLSWTDPASPAVSPTSQTVTATVGSAMTPTTAFSTSGFLGTVSYAVSPELPAGLVLNAATGVVSGTPSTAAATSVFTITATGSLGGEDTSTVSITVSASSDPTPSPDPRPRPAPAPAASGTTSPSTSSPAVAVVPSSTPTSSGSLPSFQQPAVAQPVTGTVSLVPAQIAAATPMRTMRQEPSQTINSAPVILAPVNQPVKLLVPGLSPGVRYVVQIKSAKGFVDMGSVSANAQGQLQLPVFQKTKPSETTIAIVSPTGQTTYVKVSSAKGSGRKTGSAKSGAKGTSAPNTKPAQSVGTRR